MEITVLMPELYQDHMLRDQSWAALAEKCWSIQQARKEYERLEAHLMDLLKEKSEGQSSKGGSLIFSCFKRKGSIDYGSIPYLKSLDLERFRKPEVQTWSLKKS